MKVLNLQSETVWKGISDSVLKKDVCLQTTKSTMTPGPRSLYQLQTALQKLMSWNKPFLGGKRWLQSVSEVKQTVSSVWTRSTTTRLSLKCMLAHPEVFGVQHDGEEAQRGLVIMDNPTRTEQPICFYLQTFTEICSVPTGGKYSFSLQRHF